MPLSLSNRILKFSDFNLHHLVFKNVSQSQFNELYDAVNEYLFTHQAIILNSTLTGNKSAEKTIIKAAKHAFDEINWPVIWFGNDGSNNLSGNFIAASGVNVKAFVGEKFITKVFDATSARFLFTGNILSTADSFVQQMLDTQKAANTAVEMVGLTVNDIIRTWHFTEFNAKLKTASYPVNSLHNKHLATVICNAAVQTKQWASCIAVQTKSNSLIIDAIGSVGKIGGGVLIHNQNTKWLMLQAQTNIEVEPAVGEPEIESTIQVIEKLMHENGFEWNQLWRGVAYYAGAANLARLKNSCNQRHIPLSALLMVEVTVCPAMPFFTIEVDFASHHEG